MASNSRGMEDQDMVRPAVAQPTDSSQASARIAPDDELEMLRRENALLREALAARKVIELAKALLMVRDGLSEPDAHRYIQKSSMDARVPMVEIARGLIPTQTARPGRVTTPRVRPAPWAAAAPRPDSSSASARRWPDRALPDRMARPHHGAGSDGRSALWPRPSGRPPNGQASAKLM
jgi:hypothetical protein